MEEKPILVLPYLRQSVSDLTDLAQFNVFVVFFSDFFVQSLKL